MENRLGHGADEEWKLGDLLSSPSKMWPGLGRGNGDEKKCIH